MKKIVVSSFYNGLINYEEAIPVSTMLEIERLRKKEIAFSVCTNRLYTEVLDYNRDFPFLDYIIALNGSYIYDVQKKKCLFKKKLTKKVLEKIDTHFSNAKIYYYTATAVLETINPQEDIYKVEIELSSNKYDDDFLEKIPVNISIFNYNQKKYLEITSSLTENYLALTKIASMKGLEPIAAIVANEADLSLVKNLKLCYVMDNAPSILKKYSKLRTTSNDSKGVELILKKI